VAGAIPNPALGLSYSHTFTYQPNDTSCAQSNATCSVDGFAINLSDQAALFDSLTGKRGLRLRVARTALDAARHGRADAQRTLEFQLKQQYIQAVLARDQLDFALEVQTSTTQTLRLNETRYEKGAISEADVAKVETAKLEADQAVSTARQALLAARLGLAFLLGVRGQVPPFEVVSDLPKYFLPSALAAATRDTLFKQALDRRPDLKAATRQRDRAAAAIVLAKRQRIPDIALDVNYQQQGSGGVGTNAPLTPPTLTFGVTAPLPLFYQQQGEIRKAEADLKTQDAQQAKLEAQVLSDIGTAFANFNTTRELVERMEGRLLNRAQRVRDLTAIQYQKGAASLLEFLDAQRTYISVNVEHLQDLANYWIALFALEQAVGMDFRG
jgi:cobalt-zinc-cadmium efflux system outer membrane protein